MEHKKLDGTEAKPIFSKRVLANLRTFKEIQNNSRRNNSTEEKQGSHNELEVSAIIITVNELQGREETQESASEFLVSLP